MSIYGEEEMKQYYLEREDFVSLFEQVFGNYGIDIEQIVVDGWTGERFHLFWEDDEYYILDMQTGMMLNWYKHLGRTNTCNQIRTIEEIKEFLELLKEDLENNYSGEVTINKSNNHKFGKLMLLPIVFMVVASSLFIVSTFIVAKGNFVLSVTITFIGWLLFLAGVLLSIVFYCKKPISR